MSFASEGPQEEVGDKLGEVVFGLVDEVIVVVAVEVVVVNVAVVVDPEIVIGVDTELFAELLAGLRSLENVGEWTSLSLVVSLSVSGSLSVLRVFAWILCISAKNASN